MDTLVYDLAQLIHQLDLAPVTIVAHSLGGNIALRYTGLYPENVAKLVAIEGLGPRSEEHTSELQSLMRISYAVFCLKKKNTNKHKKNTKIIKDNTTESKEYHNHVN